MSKQYLEAPYIVSDGSKSGVQGSYQGLKKLDSDTQNKVLKIVEALDLSNSQTILQYGAESGKNLTNFSNELLRQTKLKDSPDADGLLSELCTTLNAFDYEKFVPKKRSMISKLFNVGSMQDLSLKFDSVDKVIETVSTKLESMEFEIYKDIELLSTLFEQNIQYIHELDMLILAGDIKVEVEQAALEALAASMDNSDIVTVNLFNVRKDDLSRLERRIFNLRTMRATAANNIPTIQMLKGCDSLMLEKNDVLKTAAIPMWRQNMALTIIAQRQAAGIGIQKSVTDANNAIIRRNSELVRANAVNVMTEAERSVVDIETLRASSNAIIQTIQDITKISENGRVNRIKATQELVAIQTQINQSLMGKFQEEKPIFLAPVLDVGNDVLKNRV